MRARATATATAFSPASVGNAGVGFDVLGYSIEGLGDRACVRRTSDGSIRIAAIRGLVTDLPREPHANTAGRALLWLQSRLPVGSGIGFEVELEKGIPLGSGLGGSAASAVAAVVAANALLDPPLSLETLYEAAMEGEAAASGSRHGDNVAPMLLGGLTIAPAHGAPVRLAVPPWLFSAVVHPHFVLETKRAREALAASYALHDVVVQMEGLALVLAGCAASDAELIRRGFRDVIAEPRRKGLIQGFDAVKAAAMECGALGASISGAGPSVFGWFVDRLSAERAAKAMVAAFARAGLSSDAYVSTVAGPAAKVESCDS